MSIFIADLNYNHRGAQSLLPLSASAVTLFSCATGHAAQASLPPSTARLPRAALRAMTSESACAKDLPAGGRLPCKVSRIPLIPPLQPEGAPRLRRNAIPQSSPVRALNRKQD